MNTNRALEQGAIDCFVAEYNLFHLHELSFVEMRQPKHPDALCRLNGQDIAVEITHIYRSETDAIKESAPLNKPLPDKVQQKVKQAELNPNNLLTMHVIWELNDLLAQKARKAENYEVAEGTPIWLLVRSTFRIWDKQEFLNNKSAIVVPKQSRFQQIWLVCERDGGLLRLSP